MYKYFLGQTKPFTTSNRDTLDTPQVNPYVQWHEAGIFMFDGLQPGQGTRAHWDKRASVRSEICGQNAPQVVSRYRITHYRHYTQWPMLQSEGRRVTQVWILNRGVVRVFAIQGHVC